MSHNMLDLSHDSQHVRQVTQVTIRQPYHISHNMSDMSQYVRTVTNHNMSDLSHKSQYQTCHTSHNISHMSQYVRHVTQVTICHTP